MTDKGLGRLEPTDWVHTEKYGLRLTGTPTIVERTLKLPYAYRPKIDQRSEGACVGAAWTWAMAILNRQLYDLFWLYREAQKVDEWPGENYSGTSVRAGGDILRKVGHKVLHRHTHDHAPELRHGIERNEWLSNVDQARMCIDNGIPIVFGVDWMTNFDRPVKKGHNEYWIGEGDLGRVRGGHAITAYAASDKRQAFKLVNSWGRRFELVWIPYDTVQKLLDGIRHRGEGTIITDRV